jgi:DNA-binding transcriptional LysR family regulator
MTHLVDLRLLCSFRTLGDELHFARAARRLNMAQPTLSQQIRRLERQLGFDLFLRSSRRVELTEAGRVLLPAAASGMDTIDNGISAARRVAERPSVLTLAVEFDLGEEWVEGIRAFVEASDTLRVRVMRLHEGHLLDSLRSGQLDGALNWSPPEVSGFAAHRVGQIPALIAMAHDHPLAAGPAVSPDQLARHPLVMFERAGSPALWDHYVGLLSGGRPEALRIIEVMTVGASQHALLAAIRGTGRLTLVTPDHWALADTEGLVALPLDPHIAFPVFWSEAPGPSLHETAPLLEVLRAIGSSAGG